jgi:hypothetical protein
MRNIVRCASAALAASLLLAACSSGSGSQNLPSSGGSPMLRSGGAQAVAPVNHGPRLIVVGAHHGTASCGSEYLECLTVGKGHPAAAKICAGAYGCYSSYFPNETWSEDIYSVKTGGRYKKIQSYIYPNPGNPIVDFFYTNHKFQNSHGVVNYYQHLEACPTSGSCLTADIGIATE